MKAGSSRTIEMLFDWTRENVTKDWSLTAWGEKGNVSVTNNANVASDHMPSSGLWEDGRDIPTPPSPSPGPVPPTPTPTPTPEPGQCVDTNNGATDRFDDDCAAYEDWPLFCGSFDTEDFKAEEMCCVCGGGKTGEEKEEEKEEEKDEDKEEEEREEDEDEERDPDKDPKKVFEEFDDNKDGRMSL
jgi:hypothetical protein